MDFRRIAVWLALITVVCLATGAMLLKDTLNNLSARQNRSGEPFTDTKAVALASVKKISITSVSPSVSIVPTTDSQVTAKISGRFSSAPELVVTPDTNAISIEVRRQPNVISWYMADGLLEVQVPAKFGGTLEVSTSSAGVRIRDFSLDSLDVRCSSGDVECSSITAAKTLIQLSSGDIEMTSHAGSVDLTTISGNIEAEIKAPGDAVLVHASSGNVDLRLPKASSLELTAQSSSGRVTCELPITLRRSSRNFIEGTIGQMPAHTKVDIVTRSGNITIRGQ